VARKKAPRSNTPKKGRASAEDPEDAEELGPEPERNERELLEGIQEGELTHRPVMVQEVLAFASAGGREVVLDCTLGLGGHALALLADLKEIETYVGMDVDPRAVEEAEKRLAVHLEEARKGKRKKKKPARRVVLSHRSYVDLDLALDEAEVDEVDVALFDLGASTYQLTDPERGFSVTRDGPLDMRMDPSAGPTALELIRRWSSKELREVLARGEVRNPGRVARALKKEEARIRTTGDLAEVVKRATPVQAGKRSYTHPATLVFQTLRVEVNQELRNIQDALPKAVERLKPGGRLLVLTFHSLEDRIVKRFMKQEVKGCTCPPDFPQCTCGRKPTLEILAKRPLVPGEAELARNAASRSAKLRVARKLEP